MVCHTLVSNQKIRIPNNSEYRIIREDIQNLIDQSDKNVIFLLGQSGYGKTETIADYCIGKREVLWYTLNKEDNNESIFIEHFLRAAQEIDKKNSRKWKDNFLKLTRENSRKILQKLLEATQEIKELYMVFDGLHWIQNANILNFIKMILENTISNMKIFILSQEKMQDCFSKYLSKGNYIRFSEREMAFSNQEIEKVIKKYFPAKQVEIKYIEQMREITLGWPVAVSMLLQKMKENGENIENILGMTRKNMLLETELSGYIAYEIFQSLSFSCQDFLLKTTPLEELEEELCDFCLTTKNSKKLIHILFEKRILQISSIEKKETFQIFPVIKEYLKEKVERNWEEKIRKQAGIYYLSRKEYTKAFPYVKNDVEQITFMLEKCGTDMLKEEQYTLLGTCISCLEKNHKEFSAFEIEIAVEYFYRIEEIGQMEKYLNLADSMFGKENKYGMYRSLYRGLFRYNEDPEKYGKQVNNVLFFLKENHIVLPYLIKSDQETLDKIVKDKKNEQKTKEENKLSVTAFGTFCVRIIEDGKELPWRTKKGCEVFAYLLDKNGAAVDRQTLLFELWKDDIPNNAVAMLHNMFYHIRKELSYYNLEHLIQYKNKKYTMNVNMIQSDLERVCKIASYVESEDIMKLREYTEVLKRYWGRYMENIDNTWVQMKQEYYEKIFEKGCKMLAYDYMKQGKYEEAILYFKNALLINVYSEKIVGKILECYSKIGDLKSVKKRYEDFTSFLKRELDLEPGEELKQAYQACLDSR